MKLKNLTKLSMSHNQIVKIPLEIKNLCRTLQHLNLSNNKIEQIPKELFKCTSLRGLLINNNNFISFPVELHNLKYLYEFTLDWLVFC